jgi:aminobutyraldehyde dehydrogenase
MQTKLLIDGERVTGEGAAERVLDPATGKCIAEVPEASARTAD